MTRIVALVSYPELLSIVGYGDCVQYSSPKQSNTRCMAVQNPNEMHMQLKSIPNSNIHKNEILDLGSAVDSECM